jgi:superfamily II DNA or RNA helicase
MRMSVPNNDIETIRNLRLSPHQAELVQDMLASSLPVRRLLVGPPGSGKTIAANALVEAIAQQNPRFRILVIGPGALTAAHEYNLKRKIPGLKTAVLSRRDIRELESKVSPGQPVWPASFAAVMGMDTARRDDVYDLLKSVSWDLVILEEVHLFARSRWTLLRRILSESVFRRVLLITSAHDLTGIASLVRHVLRIDWIATQLKDWNGQPLFRLREPQIEAVEYRRTKEEVSVLRSVKSLTNSLTPGALGNMFKKILIRQAGSSPLALERTVRHLRNALVHNVALAELAPEESPRALVEDGSETDADIQSSSKQARALWRNKGLAVTALTALLERIDSLRSDAKREALESLLRHLERNADSKPKHLAIFCSSRVTASYVQSVIAQFEKMSWLLTADNQPEGIRTILDGFQTQGGILVTTGVALTGIDLRYVEVFIHYDAPNSEAEMHLRLTRSATAKNYILVDTSGVWPREWRAAENVTGSLQFAEIANDLKK